MHYEYLAWVISAVSIYQIYLAGNKNRNAWLITLGNQFLWAIFIVGTKQWGLLPITIAYTFLAIRNHYKWNSKKEVSK